jgi:hypothetical protein
MKPIALPRRHRTGASAHGWMRSRRLAPRVLLSGGMVVALGAAADPGHAAVPGALHLCALSADTVVSPPGWQGTDVWRGGSSLDTYQSVGPLWSWRVRTIYGGGYGLFATSAQTGDIYRWSPGGSNGYWTGNWSQIGGPGAEFAVTDDGLYALAPDRLAVYRYSGSGMAWVRIGGPAAQIYGGSVLLATSPGGAGVFRYQPGLGNWQHIGGPGAEFASTDGGVIYGLAPDRAAIYRYTGSGTAWDRVGGPAADIYGGSFLLATSPSSGDVSEYQGETNWLRIGGPGAEFVSDADSIYGLTPNRTAIYRYTGPGRRWTKVSRDNSTTKIVACP